MDKEEFYIKCEMKTLHMRIIKKLKVNWWTSVLSVNFDGKHNIGSIVKACAQASLGTKEECKMGTYITFRL